jgi:catechol 2,3-dioxygenase-like lactoylglutathione lyase family enzyme
MPITVEHVDFISIPTQDVARSRHFYLEVLGLPLERDTPSGFEATAGQVTLGIWAPEQLGLPFTPATNAFGMRVADVAVARSDLEAGGVEFQGDIYDTSVCHMAFFADPDGNPLMLHRRYAPVT